MMYIFEGVDGVGKDTLMDTIQAKVNMPIFDGLNIYHPEQYPQIFGRVERPLEWQKAIDFEIINFIKQTKYDVIMNRFIWSEIVYANVFRNGADSFFTDVLWKELEGVAVLLYLEAPTETIKTRLEQRKKPKKLDIINNIDNLKQQFEILIAKSNIPVHRVDVSGEYDLDKILTIFKK